MRQPPLQSRQSGQIQHFGHPLPPVGTARQAVGNVLRHGEMGKKRALLKNHPHLALFRGNAAAPLIHRPAGDGDLAGLRIAETGNQTQGGAFAAAAGAEEGGNLSRRQVQGKVVHSQRLAKPLGQAGALQHRRLRPGGERARHRRYFRFDRHHNPLPGRCRPRR